MTAAATLRRYCMCGGTAEVSSTPASAAEAIIRIWDSFHEGDGHGPATARQAAAARRRNEVKV